ncbi:MAG TPA: class I SAM-dependent methyltransferase [Ramlibacter sp.]|uniref:class I SAM-dependent methyltransferase n=1 Tax=Ramlibacter sp. TaxID=1917967 RepID=UPI002D7FD54B|nr:class I SAM-dependent methyltransferase [Ramlibacter sp.]HET8748596.1 class I SAM-dependent methyltransferase [Ramlibacter sp.]
MAENSKVRDLYEAFPFPARSPGRDGPESLPLTRTDILGKVDHHLFGGRRDFRQGFRTLVAGGGTGDAAIFLAAQLQDCEAEVVCLDLSEASLAIARQRAAALGLESRIRWVRASLLEAPRLGLGLFDYITCLGVLHHLADPDAGLRALVEVLGEGGGMGLMVYGRYGRADIYAMQDLMRLVNRDEADLRRQVENCRESARALSPAHLMLRGRSREQLTAMLADDANLADTFLHPQDRAYTVPELHRFVEDAGLQVVNFTNFHTTLRLEYEPETYLGDAPLNRQLAGRDVRERQAIGELLHGHMYVHGFYAARSAGTAASFLDAEMVPYFLSAAAAEAAGQLRTQGAGSVKLSSRQRLRIQPSRAALECLGLVDGVRDLGRIWAEAAARLQLAPAELAASVAPEFERFNALNWVFLRHKSCAPSPMLAYAFRGDAARIEPAG